MLFRRSPVVIPADLRTSLEAARLDLLALFRALDQMDLTAGEIPQSLLRQLFELDADYAEALWALDQPPARCKLRAMLRDTSAALERMPQLLAKFHKMLPPRAHAKLPALERAVRKNLNPREAYSMVPSGDPQNG
jgi:hypothetical protein